MPLTPYVTKKFNAEHTRIIEQANAICAEYAAQGLQITLRQLFYQFVARGLLANRQSEYKRLGSICNDARLAGVMDWDYLIDRTRNLQQARHWSSPSDLVKWAAERYRTDLWKAQKRRIEVWVEKDAAIGVIEGVCDVNDIAYFSCRGYTSVSEIWSAAQRIRWYIEAGEQVTVLHIGDHDPSGLDMTRDIDDRLRLFITRDWYGLHMVQRRGTSVGDIKAHMRARMRDKSSTITDSESPWRVKRIALSYEQVEEYSPPPNPAKSTDARFEKYVEETGLNESWELDALDPFVLQQLIQDEIDEVRDEDAWADSNYAMEQDRERLTRISAHWSDVSSMFGEEAS